MHNRILLKIHGNTLGYRMAESFPGIREECFLFKTLVRTGKVQHYSVTERNVHSWIPRSLPVYRSDQNCKVSVIWDLTSGSFDCSVLGFSSLFLLFHEINSSMLYFLWGKKSMTKGEENLNGSTPVPAIPEIFGCSLLPKLGNVVDLALQVGCVFFNSN